MKHKLHLMTAAVTTSITIALSLAAVCITAQAQGSTNSGGSVALATMSVLAAPVGSALASSQGQNPIKGSVAVVSGLFLVTAISNQGASVNIILAPANAASNASQVSVTMAKSASDAVGMSVGTAVTAVSETTGTALIASGKVLAFIPNAIGEALLYQARVPAAK